MTLLKEILSEARQPNPKKSKKGLMVGVDSKNKDVRVFEIKKDTNGNTGLTIQCGPNARKKFVQLSEILPNASVPLSIDEIDSDKKMKKAIIKYVNEYMVK